MPKNKFQDVVLTAIMATIMVYGMVVYNVALATGGLTAESFLLALYELPIMVPIAFVLEFFAVGKIAKKLAFTVMRPTDRPQFITYAISICICCIMCPLMSLVATILFKDTKTFATWVQTWAMNFPMAICYQMFYCGPLVRLIFRAIFREKQQEAGCIAHWQPSWMKIRRAAFCVAEGSQGQEGHLHPRAEERAAAGHHADGSSHGRYAGRIGVRDSRHGVAAGECHFHAGHSADSRVRAADCTVHQRRQVRWTRWRFSGRWMRRKAKAAWSSCRKERT